MSLDISTNNSMNTITHFNYLTRFKGMSWIDIEIMLEEEEEAEKEQAQAAAIRNTIIERNALIAQGNYELEDGEIIETVE